MSRDFFRIIVEERVGKTEVLYKGDESELEKLKNKLSPVRSSEIYPAFNDDFQSAIYFYKANQSFRSQLYNICQETLPRPSRSGQDSRMNFFKWGVIAFAVLIAGYSLIQLSVFLLQFINVVKGVGH